MFWPAAGCAHHHRPPHPSCLCPPLSPPSDLVQGVAMSTSAVSLYTGRYSNKHHHLPDGRPLPSHRGILSKTSMLVPPTFCDTFTSLSHSLEPLCGGHAELARTSRCRYRSQMIGRWSICCPLNAAFKALNAAFKAFAAFFEFSLPPFLRLVRIPLNLRFVSRGISVSPS